MRGTLISLGIKFIIGAVGIILISAVPILFINGYHFEWSLYWDTVKTIIHQLVHTKDLVYKYGYNVGLNKPLTENVFPHYWSIYGYSFTIFASAFAGSLFVGLLLTYLTCLLSKKVVKVMVFILSFLESIPDILMIAFFITMVIFIFNKTGVLLFNIAGAFERSYFIPILSLAFIPSILFFRIFLLAVTDEENELYVDLAKSKGLNKSRIILVHIYRNAIITLCTHIRSIFFILLSTLVMVERLFNIDGITQFIYNHMYDKDGLGIFTVSILLFFVPVFIFMTIIRIYAEHLTGRKVAV